jgi:hypothetical protein
MNLPGLSAIHLQQQQENRKKKELAVFDSPVYNDNQKQLKQRP